MPAAAGQRRSATSGAASKRRNKSSTTPRKPKKKKPEGKHSALGTIVKVLLLGLLLTMIFMLVYVIAYVHGSAAINLDDYKSEQAQTSIIYAKNSQGKYTQIATLHGEQNRIWVELDEIPEGLQQAFICLEDKRFYRHDGVDWIRTIGAIIKYHGKQGGSTLTQQLIKNLTEENQVTIARKLKEILYALNLENNYSKEDILEAYLNTIPLGSGCYGVETAADKYFGKDLNELSIAEDACLACITKAPTAYNPLLYPEANKERRALCLDYMLDEDAINKAQYEAALAEDLIYTNSENYVAKKTDSESSGDSEINSYYVDYVIDTVINDMMEKYNYSKSEATRRVYSGGLRIYSCENPNIQSAAEYVYVNRRSFPSEPSRTETGENNTRKKVQSAITIMDYQGHVVAMVGGAGPKTINRGLNRATDSVRSPGSSIKPLSVYAPAMEEGLISYSTPVLNYALKINGKEWPQNFAGDHGNPNNRVTVQYAVAQSLNTCSAQLANKMGTTTCLNYLMKNFHMTTLVKSGKYTDSNLSSMAVGGMTHGVTTLEMCAAYATFGNGGKYYAPKCYTTVTDYKGEKTLLDGSQKPTQAIKPGTAGAMNKIMQTVVTEGTGKGCGVVGFTSYMKTGTTSDTKDKWTCGGTPYYVAAVWYGYDKQEEMTNFASGYNPAAHIWSAVMNRVHNGLSKKNFDLDDQVVERAYCASSGLLAGPNCAKKSGWYDKENLPETCNGRHSGGLSGGTGTRKRTTAASGSSTSSTSGSSITVPSITVPSVTSPPTVAPTTAAPAPAPAA
ncbi:MAG: transglycosylase domain-containing protein [Clostridia bacterium]|nr:transglycosylase domain-containing protein [Clostridia bacterium]